MPRILPALIVAAVLLAGCAALDRRPAVQPGQSEAEALSMMGQPTGRYASPDGGTRLEYATGPAGKTTQMVDLDASGKVRLVTQVLNERNFGTLLAGTPRSEVLFRYGRPSEQRTIWRQAQIWRYRYESHFCTIFVVTLEPEGGPVRDTGFAPDPICEDLRRG